MKKKVNKITVGTRVTIPLKSELEEEALANDLSFCAYLEHLLINRDNTTDTYVDALKEDLELIQQERDELIEQVEELEETISNLEDVEPIETEHQDLLQRIQELENQVSELEEENEILQAFDEEEATDEDTEIEEATFSVEDDDIYTGNLSDLKDDLVQVETQYVELKEVYESSVSNNQLIIGDLEQQIIDLKEETEKFKAAEEPHQNQLSIGNDALQFLQEKHPNLSKEEIIKSALDCSATNESKWLTVYSFSDYVNRSKSFINYQNH